MEDLFVHRPLYSMISIVLIMVVAFLAKKVSDGIFNSLAKRSIKGNNMVFLLSRRIVAAVIYAIGVYACLQEIVPLRNIGNALLGVSSLFTVVVALGTQEIAADLLSGVMISLYEPFRIGDFISIEGSVSGTIVDINMRHCELRSVNNNRIIVPNKVISAGVVSNRAIKGKQFYRNVFSYNIAYDADSDLARKVIRDFLMYDERVADKEHIDVVIAELGDNGIVLRVIVYTMDFDSGMALKFALNEFVLKEFTRRGIEIPYPNLSVRMK